MQYILARVFNYKVFETTEDGQSKFKGEIKDFRIVQVFSSLIDASKGLELYALSEAGTQFEVLSDKDYIDAMVIFNQTYNKYLYTLIPEKLKTIS